MKRLIALLAVLVAGLFWTGVGAAANGDNLLQITADT